MDAPKARLQQYSNNTLSVSGGSDLHVQYGNNYYLPQEVDWDDVSKWIFGSEPSGVWQNDVMSCDTLIRTLVFQLAVHNDKTRAKTEEFYKKGGGGSRVLDYDDLLAVLKKLLRVPETVYVVIDALDECTDQDEVCSFLETLCSWEIPRTRILASSNTTQTRETESTLVRLLTDKVYVNTSNVNQDIEAHMRKMDLGQWDDDQKDKILRSCRFRWAVGQLMELKNCNTEEQLDDTLASLPGSLTETYERVLSRISRPSDIQDLRILLCWLLYAARPLRIEELRDTVAIDWLSTRYFVKEKRLNKRPPILDQCSFLIAVYNDDDERNDVFALDDDCAAPLGPDNSRTWYDKAVLRLAHSSVFQFLLDDDKLSGHARKFTMGSPEGHCMLAQTSLAYILYSNSDGIKPTSTEAADQYPLFDYAVKYWYAHTQEAGAHNEGTLPALIKQVLGTRWEVYRLVTYSNISTRYNPWPAWPTSTEGYAEYPGPTEDLCEACQQIRFRKLQGEGFSHFTYSQLVESAAKCPRAVSEQMLDSLALEIDRAILRTAGDIQVHLRAEKQDPYILISCYCYLGRLHLYTNPVMPPAKEILGRPIHSHFRAESVLGQCYSWLENCKMTHPMCKRRDADEPPLPPRVIDVSGEHPRLVAWMEREYGNYATLTHLWGATVEGVTKTTRLMLEQRMQKIPWDALSPTFMDAVTIARAIEVPYLWIDSLCIIQDDVEDQHCQLPRMEEFYKHATLNIVAGVRDSLTGILLPRNRPRLLPRSIGGEDNIFFAWLGTEAYCDPRGLIVDRYPDGWKYASPAHRRAWNMQEIRLARRNLVLQYDEVSSPGEIEPLFGLSSQMYLQCQEEVRWEGGRRRPRESETSTNWYEMVEDYSGRLLVRKGDRLPAISSLAKDYERNLRRLGTRGPVKYLAGLWAHDIHRGLLWRADPACEIPSQQYVAPSWSWANAGGKVKHIWPPNATVHAETIDYHVDSQFPNDSFHGARNGHIIIRSSLLRLEVAERAFDYFSTWTGDITINAHTESFATMDLRIRYFLDNIVVNNESIYGLQITQRVGLLLSRGDNGYCYRRVGVMVVAKPDAHKWKPEVG
ncbi:hypothetical protein DL771_002691 [Monosporascus sp. 5C6A]|nr:hypothetical protein DL771_002691 [Monosporascus sp. 5C6A]